MKGALQSEYKFQDLSGEGDSQNNASDVLLDLFQCHRDGAEGSLETRVVPEEILDDLLGGGQPVATFFSGCGWQINSK